MLILNRPDEVQNEVQIWRRQEKIAFVPTMGCLHEGHLELVRRAKEWGDKCVVSIFVNPLQFGPNEDFQRYPRMFDEDVQSLKDLGVDLIFHPSVEDLYPQSFQTRVKVGTLGDHFCGRARPGHFDGVATVCLKLFEVVQPDFAILGKKDFQQLRIIEKMVEDFNLPLRIVGHDIVREEDGLAMSSRNRYLTPEQRALSLRIKNALDQVQAAAADNASTTVKEALLLAGNLLEHPAISIDYVEIADSQTLQPANPNTALSDISFPRLLIAIKIGATRLIDNAALGQDWK